MAASAAEFDLASTLLDCLTEALEQHPNPPARACVRVGEEVRQDLSLYEDECCDGLAYVKINSIYETENFPDPTERAGNCNPTWAVDLEMGVFRCAPQGTVEAVAPCEQWNDAALQVSLDAKAMRRAVACFRDKLDPGELVLARAWAPIGPEGACTGGTQVVTSSLLLDC